MPPLSELGGTNLLRQFIALSRGLIKSANGWYHQDSSGRLVRRTFVCRNPFFPCNFFVRVQSSRGHSLSRN